MVVKGTGQLEEPNQKNVEENISTDISTERIVSAEQLANIDSFDAAIQALADANIAITDVADELGDGFEVLEDKDQLIGMPFIILNVRHNPMGDYGPFVSLQIVTKDGRKLVVNDGSTGIYDQTEIFYNKTGKSLAGYYCKHGLRASEFRFCEDCKSTSAKGAPACHACGSTSIHPAKTFYIDTSK